MRRALLAAALVTAASAGLFAGGCQNSSTEPNRTLAFTGTLPKGTIAIEPVSMRHVGNLRMELVDLQTIDAEGNVSPSTSGLIVGIGNGPSDLCPPTANFGLLVGTAPTSLGLEKGTYCLRVAEGVTQADGASLRYNIKVEITD